MRAINTNGPRSCVRAEDAAGGRRPAVPFATGSDVFPCTQQALAGHHTIELARWQRCTRMVGVGQVTASAGLIRASSRARSSGVVLGDL